MNYLKGGDTIPYGVYSGKRLRDVVKKYGREVLLEIVKYNEVDDDYLKRYHYHHPATDEEKRNWEMKLQQMETHQEGNCISTPTEEVYVTTVSEVMEEEIPDQEESMVNICWEGTVLYDPEDDPEEYKPQQSPIHDKCQPYYEEVSVWNQF